MIRSSIAAAALALSAAATPSFAAGYGEYGGYGTPAPYQYGTSASSYRQSAGVQGNGYRAGYGYVRRTAGYGYGYGYRRCTYRCS